MPVLQLTDVRKRYGRGRWVLNGLDLRLNAGEVVAISAANGAGKSTRLRVIVGACRPSSGFIGQRPARTRYVPDRVAVHARMPALTCLTHMGRVQGMSTTAARSQAVELLDRLKLVGHHQTPMHKLSRGNAQKVALAQAVLTSPELLVLDEPWSGLDATTHVELSAIISAVAASGGVVVFTDHREDTTRGNASVRFHPDDGVRAPIEHASTVAVATPAPAAVAAPAPAAVVVLFRTDGAPTDGHDWTRAPGVLDVRLSEDFAGTVVMRLELSPGQVDTVLLTALAKSWSVARVERNDGPPCSP